MRKKSVTKKQHELEKSKPQVAGEQSAFGHMPNPGKVKQSTTLERAQKMGLYTEANEAHPHELNIAEELREKRKARKKG